MRVRACARVCSCSASALLHARACTLRRVRAFACMRVFACECLFVFVCAWKRLHGADMRVCSCAPVRACVRKGALASACACACACGCLCGLQVNVCLYVCGSFLSAWSCASYPASARSPSCLPLVCSSVLLLTYLVDSPVKLLFVPSCCSTQPHARTTYTLLLHIPFAPFTFCFTHIFPHAFPFFTSPS